MSCRHQEFQFPLLGRAHCGTECEHQVLNGSRIFISFTRILELFGTTFQYSRKRRQDEEGKQSNKAAIPQLVLTFCPTMRCCLKRKLKLLMPVFGATLFYTQFLLNQSDWFQLSHWVFFPLSISLFLSHDYL